MRQKAVVLETNGTIARIKVFRSTMCEGCAKRGESSSCACGELMGANRIMIAEADNAIGASVGDTVEIETSASVVLAYAALVFMLPVAAFFLLYALTEAFLPDGYLSWIAGGAGFLLSFIPILITDRKRRGKAPQIRIAALLDTASSSEDSCEDRSD